MRCSPELLFQPIEIALYGESELLTACIPTDLALIQAIRHPPTLPIAFFSLCLRTSSLAAPGLVAPINIPASSILSFDKEEEGRRSFVGLRDLSRRAIAERADSAVDGVGFALRGVTRVGEGFSVDSDIDGSVFSGMDDWVWMGVECIR